jgi:hypothetical protein
MKRRCKLLYLGLYYSLGWTTFNSGSTGDSNRLGARVTGRCAQSMEHAQPQLAAPAQLGHGDLLRKERHHSHR